jgi:hypothetical protein
VKIVLANYYWMQSVRPEHASEGMLVNIKSKKIKSVSYVDFLFGLG